MCGRGSGVGVSWKGKPDRAPWSAARMAPRSNWTNFRSSAATSRLAFASRLTPWREQSRRAGEAVLLQLGQEGRKLRGGGRKTYSSGQIGLLRGRSDYAG